MSVQPALSPNTLAEINLELEKCRLERERLLLQREAGTAKSSFLNRNWQGIVSVAVSIAACSVSVGQWMSTRSVQQQEVTVKKVETLQKFLPDLADPEKKDAALHVLVSFDLFDRDQVTELARKLKATKVLSDLDKGGSQKAGEYAKNLNQQMDRWITELFSNDAVARRSAAATLISDWGATSGLVPRLLDYASGNAYNENGIYNTVVVLEALNPETLKPYVPAIRDFCELAKKNGPKTAAEADALLRRLQAT